MVITIYTGLQRKHQVKNDIRFVKGDSTTTNTIHVTFWSGRKAKYKCDDRIYYIAAYERLRRNIQYPF